MPTKTNLSVLDRTVAAIGAVAIVIGGWWIATVNYADIKSELASMRVTVNDTHSRVVRLEDRELGDKVAGKQP